MRDSRTVEDVLVDDQLRFVDVLLEEELAAPRVGAAVPARRTPWVAAALVLLGLGVLVGATLLRADPAAPAQEPAVKPPTATPFAPTDAADLAAFLQRVVAVRVQPLQQVSSGFESEWTTLPGAEAVEQDPAALRVFHGAWTTVAQSGPTAVPDVRAQMRAADGRRLEVHFRDANVLRIGDTGWNPGRDAAVRLRQLTEQARQNEIATRARVTTLAELREVRPSVRWLSCAALPIEELQEQLPRLRAIESLCMEGIVDDRIGTVLASLPALAELDLVGTGLTEPGWLRVAKLPRLRVLRIHDSIPGLTREAVAEVGAKLETLAIVGGVNDPFPVPEHLLSAIAGLRGLRELQVAVAFDGDDASVTVRERGRESLVAALCSLPNLRRFAFATRDGEPPTWLQYLAASRIEKLRLAETSLDERAVASLGAIATLRELDLRGVGSSVEARAALSRVRQLTRLDVHLDAWSADQMAALRTELPHCHVLGQPNTSGRIFAPLGLEPSWTRDD